MTFRNNIAGVYWVFSALFLVLVATLTYIFIRDGAPVGYPPVIVGGTLAFFWIGALGLAAFSAGQHCLRVTIQPDSRVSIARRFPFRNEERTMACAEITPATVFESTDDEGAPYFHARVPIQDGTTIDITDGHHRESCEKTCARFNAIVWPHVPDDPS